MSLLGGGSSFFGLDIGSSALRAVELHGTGPTKTLYKYAYMPIDSKLALSDSKNDQDRLAQAIAQLVEQAKFSTRNVAVGIPSNRVFTTVDDVDRLPDREMEKSIRYQADALIPTPLNESKIDWAVLGDSPLDKTKAEIMLTSVPNDFIERRLDIIESTGLNTIAFEPDNLALARALSPADATYPYLILDMGRKSTDLVTMLGGLPRLTRSIPTGMEAIIRSGMQNLNIDEKQAEQFILKFGLSRDKLEGQVYEAIINTVELLTTEIDKSIKFFQTRYAGNKITRIIVTGGGAILPEFPLYLANKFTLEVEIGNAWRNVQFSPDRQNELLSISNQFSVAVGLAEREA
ncbi:MAG TPA: type IV pilus assembly protein PilM [Candidatus Saccharimonadales bacterium]|nr:type IV pilus assembly protein PilM [Candidatus Saccharimonadales bacterium]